TLPPMALPTAVIVRFWPLSLAGPLLSLPRRVANGIVTCVSSGLLARLSLTTVGASFTSQIVNLAFAVLVLGSATPLFVPSSCSVYWKQAGPLYSAVRANPTRRSYDLTLPPMALPTAVIVRFWPLSLAGPLLSL